MASAPETPTISPIYIEEVRWAYRWMLGREPDKQGLSHYAGQMSAGALTRETLRAAMLNSPEFQGRQRRMVDLIDGVKVVLNPFDGDIGYAIDYHSAWEPHLTDLLRQYLREGDLFVDIGANVGVMSFVAARAVGPVGKVIAFEPNPTNASNFRRGMAANGLGNILLHNLAVSDRQSTLSISANTNAKADEAVDPLGANEVIQAVALDQFLADVPRLDFVKLDIEGYEMRAFTGMDGLLRRHKPLVQIEYNPLCLRHQGGIDPQLLAELIFDLSLGPISIVELERNLTPIASAAELTREWERRNAKAVEMGWLPDGWAHLDLFFRVA